MTAPIDRRGFLQGSLATALLGLGACRHPVPAGRPRTLYAPARTAAGATLAARDGFRWTVVEDNRQTGLWQPDGMTCVTAPEGGWLLLRNHELGSAAWLRTRDREPETLLALRPDAPAQGPYGGVSRVLLDPAQLQADLQRNEPVSSAVRSTQLVLDGTDRNCAGGAIDGGWVSCEESDEDGYGYAYRVLATDRERVDRDARRLDSWGRFHREAIALDPATGIAYQTEDNAAGLLYRHVPASADAPFGPGRLQALVVDGLPHTDGYGDAGRALAAPELRPGYRAQVRWVDLPDASAATTTCRQQGADLDATRFNRCEGIVRDDQGLIWFVASTAGPQGAGQLWRLDPRTDELRLVHHVTDARELSMPDNIVMAPWGDLILAEDNYYPTDTVRMQHLRGLRPDGTLYDLLRNEDAIQADGTMGGEFAGPCWSPDGTVLFVNLQFPLALTIAITGPWDQLHS